MMPVVASPPQSDVEKKIDALIKQMTLEEKLGQLQQLDGHADGNFRPEHVELARKGLLGSTLNVRGAKNVNELQRAAVDGSRLKIPLAFRLRRDTRLPYYFSGPARRGSKLGPGGSRARGSRRRC